jgi:uncharacterized tellurite resistance protein B-like protein
MSLLSWLGLASAGDHPGELDPIETLMAPLLPLGPARARYLALFAFLLARVANVDSVVGDAELARMGRELVTWGGLPPEEAAIVARLAGEQNQLTGATENFLAARELRDLASRDEKIAVLQSLFAVSAAEDDISGAEEEAIREISRELVLTNDEYLWVRSQFREKRAVMKLGRPAPA